MREKWADITKGLAIWMMVFCHANLSNQSLTEFICIFHMPVFFLISGYFDKGDPISVKAVKKAGHALIRPYFIYSFLCLSICWISPYLHPEIYRDISTSFFSIFRAAFIGMFLMEDNVTTFSFMPSGPLWFLAALFFIKLIWMFAIWIYKRRALFFFMLLLALVLAVIVFRPMFFSLDSALLALPFYIVGYALKHFGILDRLFSYSKSTSLFVFLFVATSLYLVLWGLQNGYVSIDGFIYGNNIVMFYFNGLVGSLACICVSFLLQRYDVLIHRIGQASLTILGLHSFFCIMGKIIVVSVFHLDGAPLSVLVSFFIATVTCVCIMGLKTSRWLRRLP